MGQHSKVINTGVGRRRGPLRGWLLTGGLALGAAAAWMAGGVMQVRDCLDVTG